MKFIELTRESGTKVYVNADTIQSMERISEPEVTVIHTGANDSGDYLYVLEDVEQVIMLATKGSIAYSVDFVNDMRETLIDMFNALAVGPKDKVATAWAAINKKERMLEEISSYKKGKEDSDASCLLRSIYQIAFGKGAISTEAVLKGKEELLQALCKHKQVYAENTAPDTRFKDAYLALLCELFCVDTLCEGSDYYLAHQNDALKYIEAINESLDKLYRAVFPDEDTPAPCDTILNTDKLINSITRYRNNSRHYEAYLNVKTAVEHMQDELSKLNTTLHNLDLVQVVE